MVEDVEDAFAEGGVFVDGELAGLGELGGGFGGDLIGVRVFGVEIDCQGVNTSQRLKEGSPNQDFQMKLL